MEHGTGMDALGPMMKDKKPKKLRVSEAHLRRGHAGGFIVRHDLEDENGHPHDKRHEYPMGKMEDVIAHLKEHFGEEKKEAADEKAGKEGEQ